MSGSLVDRAVAPVRGLGADHAMAALLALALALRLLLAIANGGDANDDHLEVARAILARGWSSPDRNVCWECYHAQLYHYTWAAALWSMGLTVEAQQRLIGGLLSCAAGIAWLFVLSGWLSRSSWPRVARLLGFALLAFCPEILGIQTQATNDSFAILFGSLAIVMSLRVVRAASPGSAVLASLFVVLAASSKASGWVLFIALWVALLLRAAVQTLTRHPSRPSWTFLMVLTLFFGLLVPTQQPFRKYIQVHGTPFKGALGEEQKRPRADLLEKTPFRRAGIRSLAEAFGTFPLSEMAKYPYITGGNQPFPSHRTSFWAQLHGRMTSARFAQWPRSWQSLTPAVMTIGRISILLGLIPLLATTLGLGFLVARVVRSLRQRRLHDLVQSEVWVLFVTGLLLFLMLLKVSLDHREFSAMKPIYALPGVIAFAACFMDGLTWLLRKLRWLSAPLWLLCLAFLTDVGLLTTDLLLGPPASRQQPAPRPAVEVALAEGEYAVMAAHSGKCLGLAANSRGRNDNLRQLICQDRRGQHWRFRRLADGDYRIDSGNGDLVISLAEPTRGSGAVIVLGQWRDERNQRWRLAGAPGGFVTIQSAVDGTALTVQEASGAEGAFVLQGANASAPHQRWRAVRL